VLEQFQFKVINRCDVKINTTRGIILVEPNPRVWTNEEMLSGINEKIEISFPKKYMLEFYNKANEAFSAGDLIKQFRDVNLLVKEERELSLIERK
jgi:hypothetical protein